MNNHPTWDLLSKYLSIGPNAEFKPISDSDRVKDMKEAIDRGNHKLALTHSDTLLSNVKKEVFSVPIPIPPRCCHKDKRRGSSSMWGSDLVDYRRRR